MVMLASQRVLDAFVLQSIPQNVSSELYCAIYIFWWWIGTQSTEPTIPADRFLTRWRTEECRYTAWCCITLVDFLKDPDLRIKETQLFDNHQANRWAEFECSDELRFLNDVLMRSGSVLEKVLFGGRVSLMSRLQKSIRASSLDDVWLGPVCRRVKWEEWALWLLYHSILGWAGWDFFPAWDKTIPRE